MLLGFSYLLLVVEVLIHIIEPRAEIKKNNITTHRPPHQMKIRMNHVEFLFLFLRPVSINLHC